MTIGMPADPQGGPNPFAGQSAITQVIYFCFIYAQISAFAHFSGKKRAREGIS